MRIGIKHLLIIVLTVKLCSCASSDSNNKNFLFSGNLNYERKEEQQTLKNKLGGVFKRQIYQTKDQTKTYYLGGSIYHNYDVFNKTMHINGFGEISVVF